MAEVYDIFSGEHVPVKAFDHRASSFKKIAKKNDKIRRKFVWKTDLVASLGFMKLKHNTLRDVMTQLRRSAYNRIDFGGLSQEIIAQSDKDHASATRSAGLIHAGSPTVHVVWKINEVNQKVELCLASEYFET